MHYWNEIEPYAAQWLRNLIAAGHLPAGHVDERSIIDVQPDDLVGFVQCHFFAGIGGWSLAARIAGWPDARELWTGSAPCQPFSVAGEGKGFADDRDLWPHYFRLIRARRPAVAMGEQVAAAVGKHWLDRVFTDLEGIGYACGAAVVPACAVDAPHRRDRLWFVADADSMRGEVDTDTRRRAPGSGAREVTGSLRASDGALDHSQRPRLEGHAGHDDGTVGRSESDRSATAAGCGGALGDAGSAIRERNAGGFFASEARVGGPDRSIDGDMPVGPQHASESNWRGSDTIIGHDGKARRVPESRIRLLVDGLSPWVAGGHASGQTASRVGALRAFGNAIVPSVAAEVIGAYMDCRP